MYEILTIILSIFICLNFIVAFSIKQLCHCLLHSLQNMHEHPFIMKIYIAPLLLGSTPDPCMAKRSIFNHVSFIILNNSTVCYSKVGASFLTDFYILNLVVNVCFSYI